MMKLLRNCFKMFSAHDSVEEIMHGLSMIYGDSLSLLSLASELWGGGGGGSYSVMAMRHTAAQIR